MLGQRRGTATVGPVRVLPAIAAGVAPGSEAKLGFIPGRVMLCWRSWVPWGRPGAFPDPHPGPGHFSMAGSSC